MATSLTAKAAEAALNGFPKVSFRKIKMEGNSEAGLRERKQCFDHMLDCLSASKFLLFLYGGIDWMTMESEQSVAKYN